MKWLAMVWRETQQEWFGKAGIPWHGGMALMKYVPEEGEEEDSLDDYTILYFDFITDHKKEDGFSVVSMLEGMIHLMKGLHPERTKVGIESDGAGCYSGKFARLAIPMLSEITGVQVLYHSTGEAQCNKSMLDNHFGIAGPAVTAVVASGRQDATTARDVVVAHQRSTAIANTVVREVEIDRSNEGILQPNALKKPDISVRSIALTTMEYGPDRKLSGVRFFKHAGFGSGQLVTRTALNAMWQKPQGSTGVVLIDWPLNHEGNPPAPGCGIRLTLPASGREPGGTYVLSLPIYVP